MIKKVLVTSALISAFSVSAFAGGADGKSASSTQNLKVTLGGASDVQLGYADQKPQFKLSDPSDSTKGERNQTAVVNDTNITLKVDGTADAGLGYGAFIKLNVDTSGPKGSLTSNDDNSGTAEQTMMYMEGMFGRVEAGSYTGATSAMKVDASSIARATGGIAGDAKYWWNPKTAAGTSVAGNFLVSPNLPTNEIGKYGIKTINAAKLSYYTPGYYGFTWGASYIPDLESYGTIKKASSVVKSSKTADAWPFRDIWEGGVRYEGMFNDVAIKGALLGQVGQAKQDANATPTYHHRLRAWETGFNLAYTGFSFGGSYGTWEKSGRARGATRYWTAGAGYEYGPFGASLTYFNSRHPIATPERRNTLEQLSLGFDYKVAAGLLSYAEATGFRLKDRSLDAKNNPYVTNKGAVFLAGTKLQF